MTVTPAQFKDRMSSIKHQIRDLCDSLNELGCDLEGQPGAGTALESMEESWGHLDRAVRTLCFLSIPAVPTESESA